MNVADRANPDTMEPMSHCTDQHFAQRHDRLSPLVRALIPDADLATLTDEEFEELSGFDVTPDFLCGPSLLRFHNQMREQAGTA